jgi:hypothetical protein
MANILIINNRVIKRANRIIAYNMTLAVGDLYGGGIVAYILQSGDPAYEAGKTKGLIANMINTIPLGVSYHATNDGNTGATDLGIGTGLSNTNKIITLYGSENNAAYHCKNLTTNGYTDWYLPSNGELMALYNNKNLIGVLNANWGWYCWTSSEYISNVGWAWRVRMDGGGGLNAIAPKASSSGVIAVRSFTIG